MVSGKVRVNLLVDREVWQRFKMLCRKRDVAASWVLRRFMADEVKAVRGGRPREKRRSNVETLTGPGAQRKKRR